MLGHGRTCESRGANKIRELPWSKETFISNRKSPLLDDRADKGPMKPKKHLPPHPRHEAYTPMGMGIMAGADFVSCVYWGPATVAGNDQGNSHKDTGMDLIAHHKGGKE